ncbi:CBS domain-containing protein [Denitromonas iodatirespirans]|uniref:CBS domain-containing protein n=1 Tax=Denitromonas iodatirespirans TaxID=2795389 RepID=A0A944H7Y6_DENI1|nr:CBS domain-containing protein [Denitromonas iodatirespirans]MBT0960805.1 CBS domain-containing protein [Denitromonas iodatirespirans]
MQVSEILAIKGKVLYTIAPNRSLSEAVAIMTEQDVGSLVVFEHGKMVGMLTFREVLKHVYGAGAGWQDVAIADVMVHDPLSAGPNMEMDELRRHMVDHHQRYLPVMDGDTLMGVISFHDVAKAVLEEQSFENRMLKNYIRNWPEDANEA